MLKIENVAVTGWEAAVRGMRNPMNSWAKSDTHLQTVIDDDGQREQLVIGANDLDLMQRLFQAGSEHRKYARMLTVTMDITAPLYWWKEFDTYKVGTVANSCSTMHKIHERPFVLDDFSWDQLLNTGCNLFGEERDMGFRIRLVQPLQFLTDYIIPSLNMCRSLYIEMKDKAYWWQMIQLLPSSYNQRRTVQFSYENAFTFRRHRKNHKLDEWHTLCDALLELPWYREITGEE